MSKTYKLETSPIIPIQQHTICTSAGLINNSQQQLIKVLTIDYNFGKTRRVKAFCTFKA